MSQLVSINDLEFVRKEASNQNIVVKLGNNEMVLRAPDTSGEIFDLLNTIDHGVVVSVNNSVLNWFNGPQINVNNSEQITITLLSDTEKVAKVDAYLKANMIISLMKMEQTFYFLKQIHSLELPLHGHIIQKQP